MTATYPGVIARDDTTISGILFEGGEMEPQSKLRYLATNMVVVLGLVLVSRGIWYLLDELDQFLFGGTDIFTALVGIVLGLLFLWLPEGNLKEIENLYSVFCHCEVTVRPWSPPQRDPANGGDNLVDEIAALRPACR